jgi:hypothetical protein
MLTAPSHLLASRRCIIRETEFTRCTLKAKNENPADVYGRKPSADMLNLRFGVFKDMAVGNLHVPNLYKLLGISLIYPQAISQPVNQLIIPYNIAALMSSAES